MSRYVAIVDAINIWLGRIVMYGIFVLIGILLWSSISKAFFMPSLWTLEMAQFALVAYYILGGPYCLQGRQDNLVHPLRQALLPGLQKRRICPAFSIIIDNSSIVYNIYYGYIDIIIQVRRKRQNGIEQIRSDML